MLAYFFHAKNRINVNSTLIIERTQNTQHRRSWQRRMGVEPTGDRAERPPSRFEDGETHRGPYTSICVAVFCHSPLLLSRSYCFFNQVLGCALPLPPSGSSPSTLLRVNQEDHDHQQLLCNACL